MRRETMDPAKAQAAVEAVRGGMSYHMAGFTKGISRKELDQKLPKPQCWHGCITWPCHHSDPGRNTPIMDYGAINAGIRRLCPRLSFVISLSL